ncbi:MAG: hypothetical protein J07HQW1_02043 [Haloquadratum walsbyi J07HQW1]|uniref:Uncharacterized protein n=1 Tax=Haloquadratum walsbyi J07HQW1 TaxID=1238424 RepID=U1MPV6_9EURY|nr:MAG: hypothetical protein J07HQW1_02043 [Haloquadratum walsbyi J07HQW1]
MIVNESTGQAEQTELMCPNGHQNDIDEWRLERFRVTCDECGIRWNPAS